MIKKIILYTTFMLMVAVVNGLTLNLDTNNDKKDDRWIEAEIMKDWKKFDFNKNNKPDESFLYVSDKNIIYFINSETFDHKGNGKVNIWIKNEMKGNDVFSEIKADQNYDGKIDLFVNKKNDVIYIQKTDSDFDGKVDVEEHFDISSGKKVKESVDTNKDSVMDDFYFFTNELLMKEELDINYDGKADMWVLFTYNADGSLKECVIQKDNNADGKADEWHYTDNKRRIIKVEKSTKCDGNIDYVKNYK